MSRLVSRTIRWAAAVAAVAVMVGCSDLLEPTPELLAGTWRNVPDTDPSLANLQRTIAFSVDGSYVVDAWSGPSSMTDPPDSVGWRNTVFGTYSLRGATLTLAQDSTNGRNGQGGTWHYGKPAGMDVEGPPTDPVVRLTTDRLVLTNKVNPGAGYVTVVATYDRVP